VAKVISISHSDANLPPLFLQSSSRFSLTDVAATSALSFNPSAWDPYLIAPNPTQEFIDSFNSAANCYVYALADRDMVLENLTYRINPGAIAGSDLQPERRQRAAFRRHHSADNIKQLAQADGLELTGDQIVIRRDWRPIAFFVCAGFDFHWVRMDNDATYSHKLPYKLPEKLVFEDSGKPVRDLRQIKIETTYKWYGKKTYSFAAFFNVPPRLEISIDAIERTAQNIERISPQQGIQWRRHLKRLNLPNSGRILIPQIA